MEKRDPVKIATSKAREMQTTTPRALAARYDRRTHRIVVRLSSKLDIAFDPHDAQGLEKATPEELKQIEISPSGFGIHFPKIDADLYIPALLEGFLGSRSWMASRMGQRGGASRSKAKKDAARQNGQLGGRPRKKTAA